MIEIRNLYKKFGRLEALNNINLHCKKGECIALIGPNGCGKTTLIKSILGMVIPDQGTILFENKDIKGEYSYRENLGYMPQIGRYPDNLSIGQIIEMVKEIRKSNTQVDEDLIHDFKLRELYSKKMNTLSGGTRQKVSATLAFLFNPQALILDEPTAGLDPLAAELLKEKIIKEKEKGKLVLITSHQLSELDELISQVILMQDGNILFHKNTEELKSSTGEVRISKAIASIIKGQVHG